MSKPVTTRTYAATAPCGQNLVDTSFVAEGAKYGENITVVACGTHEIGGYIEVDTPNLKWNGSFGRHRDADNSRCVARDLETAATASHRSGSTDQPKAGQHAAAAAGSTAPATRPVTAFRQWTYSGEVCRYAMTTVMGLLPLERGTRIGVRIWSPEPIDLEGAVIRITHNIEKPNVSEAEWDKHLAKREAEEQRRLAREKAKQAEPPQPGEFDQIQRTVASAEPDQDDRSWIGQRERGPSGPPPAARAETPPPRPSVNAEWLAGYWHWNQDDWVWIGGSWRVPQADVAGGLTVRAPHAPPPLRAETQLAARPGLIWIAGYWQWNGHDFVWVPGCYRRAPHAHARWRAARWQASGPGVVFLPGGWR